jgi:Calx-beta domain
MGTNHRFGLRSVRHSAGRVWHRLKQTLGLDGAPSAGPVPSRRFSRLQRLEDRSLLSGGPILVVDTAADVRDGNTSSIAALLANKGADGHISLREAILAANNTPGADRIQFGILAGPLTIQLSPVLGVLPVVSDPLTIDGTTQPGYAGAPLIELNGSLLPGSPTGLKITAGATTVRGLVINGFGGYGIDLKGNGGNVLQGNYVGTDLTGLLPRGNGLAGVVIEDSPDNLVGGTTAAARNVISGNGQDGVDVIGSGSTGNLLQGNYIGTDVTGTLALGNASNGVWISNGATDNTVGGFTPGAGNLLSGNGDDGVEIGDNGATGNLIQGNRIGTDVTGILALGNDSGVVLQDAPDNLLGGTVAGAGNVIAGNLNDGVLIFGNHATGNLVQGNWIGTDPTGTLSLLNTGAGVAITDQGDGAGVIGSADDNVIGGTSAGAGNTIAFNTAAGVAVRSGAGNAVRGNSIFANGGLGIDLGPTGVTPNDNNDTDTGANDLQNFPLIHAASTTGTDVTVQVKLSSQPGTRFTIDFYASPVADPSGYGEGATYLGSTTATTNGGGNISFSSTFTATVPVGYVVTATATDPGGNTSEFSAAVLVSAAPAVTVTPTSGLVTTEAGGTATFTVVLGSPPTADVTIPVSSSNPAEGTVSTPALTFTALNWNVPQTVTVTGVDDFVVDGDVAYTIVLGPAASADPLYDGLDPADVAVTNMDNDRAGITVTPTSGLTTTEAGGTATFTVVLTSQPTAAVTIGLSSSNPSEGTVSTSSLTFTPANWNVPQTVTVTGVDDFVVDGDIAYTIVTAPAVSPDPNYQGLDPADVAVINRDNDHVGITVSPVSGLVTNEGGGTATFTVVLTSQPTADVIVPVASSDTTEGTVSTPSLTFTPANWNVAQTVTVTGVDDLVADGDQPYTIVVGPATSADPSYNGFDPADVAAVNLDNDVPGVTISQVSGLVTTEAGGTARFTVVLNTLPLLPVTVNLVSSNPAEGTVSTSSLTFTAANWNVPQAVTVTGVDDFVADGNIAYQIVTSISSLDPVYGRINPPDVSVTNLDNDTAGVRVTPTSGLVTTEAGGTASFSVVLTSQPTANVTIGLSSSDPGEGTVSVSSLTFTPADWNLAQTVTVTGVDDFVADGDVPYTIVLAPAASADPGYRGLDPADVAVTNRDNDTPGVLVSPTTGLVTTEAGGTASFTVVLTSQPTATVTIPLASSDPTEGRLSTSSLTFTTTNWNVAQAVTVTGVDDFVADGDQVYTVAVGAAVSLDPNYNGRNAPGVVVTNRDDDTAGIRVSPVAGLVTTEGGGTVTFTVVLTSEPTADVTTRVSSSNPAEGTTSVSSLTFTAANWDVPQTVTVTGVNDFVVDGDQPYTIVLSPAASTDPGYNGLDPADVAVTNRDDDTAGVRVTPVAGLVTTEAGGTATFTVVLTSRPLADVTVGIATSNAAEGTPSVSRLTFTPLNWDVAQTVTVTGVDDSVADGDVVYSIVTSPAVSLDPRYSGLDAPDVRLVNKDNDVAGIVVTPTTGLVTTEGGGTATFAVSLTSQPTADVTIDLASSNPAGGLLSTARLTFTPADWNNAQTVTVTGLGDAGAAGDITYRIEVGPARSSDAGYSGQHGADVLMTLRGAPASVAPNPTPAPVADTTARGPVVSLPVAPATSSIGVALLAERTAPPAGAVGPAAPAEPAPIPSAPATGLVGLTASGYTTPRVPRLGGVTPTSSTAVSEVTQEARRGAIIPVDTTRVSTLPDAAAPPVVSADLPPIAEVPVGDLAPWLPVRTPEPVLPRPQGPAPVLLPTELLWQGEQEAAEVHAAEHGPSPQANAWVGTGVLASAGYVLLNTRTGLWLLSLLTAKPLWRQFDPLEILYAWEQQGGGRAEEEEDGETLVSLVK